jgi:hypothetical protein
MRRVSGARREAFASRAVTAPGVIELGDESDDQVVWKRLGQQGVDKACELWSAVASR